MNKTETSEILRLRKELVHQRSLTTDLQEELEEKTNLYIKAISVSIQYHFYPKISLINKPKKQNFQSQYIIWIWIPFLSE